MPKRKNREGKHGVREGTRTQFSNVELLAMIDHVEATTRIVPNVAGDRCYRGFTAKDPLQAQLLVACTQRFPYRLRQIGVHTFQILDDRDFADEDELWYEDELW